MLRLTTERPTVYNDKLEGYARYRIDFEDVDTKHDFVLGWISPRYPTVESFDHLNQIKNWANGWVREVYQDDTTEVKRFRVRLYRKGLSDDDLFLVEEKIYGRDPLE